MTVPNPIRVLLADDHAVVRAGIRQFLELSGEIQVVAEADDGAMAKSLIEQIQPDVAILDIQMPAASGIEVTRWMRANFHKIGILILTAFDDDPYILAVLQAGANGYLLKTASPAEIIQAVHDVHAGKSAVNSAITQKLVAHITRQRDEKPVELLTDREVEVIILAAKGHTNKAIAIHLGISDRTVQGHLSHIFDKLNATSRTEAVMRAYSMGLVPQGVLDQV
ncbi:MAG TPA: response regulator transcription factor [Anaerolineales bacterium]|nr:response regulator transcription factor [Anaerolineales bacterium]